MSLYDDFQESAKSSSANVSSDGLQTIVKERHMNREERTESRKSKKLDSDHIDSESRNGATNSLFNLKYVQFRLPAVLNSMAVQNNILVAAMDDFKIIRINLDDPLHVDVVDIPENAAVNKILDLFLDPTGRHVIISTQNEENYYLFHKWNTPRKLAKLRGIRITSVAWNKQVASSATSTRQILLGSDQGTIYETILEPTTEDTIFKEAIERYVIRLYNLTHTAPNVNDKVPITGLQIENFPGDSSRYLIMVATPTRLYQFNGSIPETQKLSSSGAFFESIITQDTPEQCLVLPSNLTYSHIVFFNRSHELQATSVRQDFAWLNGTGIFCGHLNLTGGTASMANHDMITEASLIPFPLTNYDERSDQLVADTPITLCLTEFHIILLYKRHVRATCRLTDKVVYQEAIPLQEVNEAVRGMTADDSQHTYWIYTTAALYELVIQNESRDVWKFYLQKKQYDKALQFATTSAQRIQIYEAQAENDFKRQKYMESAQYYAKVNNNRFEEIILKFIQKGERAALQYLLTERLSMMKRAENLNNSERTTQVTIMATWLLKLKLSELSKLEDIANSVSFTSLDHRKITETQQQSTSDCRKQLLSAKDELCSFLNTHHMDLHKPTTYKMLMEQGLSYVDLYLYYACLMGDHEKIINHWIHQRNWEAMIDVLDSQSNAELIYKYSCILMENEPKKTVDMWIRHEDLNPKNIIPAILCYKSKRSSHTTQHECIRYLTHVISAFGNTDPLIHNLLLTMYATKETKDETTLLAFLKNEGREMRYDLKYALKLCKRNNLDQSCIYIYSRMGFFEDAVGLALKSQNLEVAMLYADKAEENESLRKKLWVQIAKHIIQVEKDPKSGIGLLKQCDLIGMEDILPFFPDDVLIDEYKDEICAALEEYNVGVEGLRQEMDNATSSSENIRTDIRTLKKRFDIVKEEQHCCVCRCPLLTRQFYVFSCNHQFHADCLHSKISKYLPTRLIRQLADLQQSISEEYKKLSDSREGAEDRAANMARIANLRHQFDTIVARQCFMCGDAMIESIHAPFVNEDEGNSWSIRAPYK